jgi:hypothetical protein
LGGERTGRLRDADELEARFAHRFLEKTAEEWFDLAPENATARRGAEHR